MLVIPNLIIDLVVDRVDLVDEGANSAAFIKLYKRKESNEKMDMEKILAQLKPEHLAVVQEGIAKAKAEVPEATATELAKAKEDLDAANKELEDATVEIAKSKVTAEPDFEEVLKSLDPSVQKVYKSMQAQKEAAEKVALDATEKSINDEAIAKAKELKALPVEEAKLVTILKGASPEILELLKSANQAIADGSVFEEVGKARSSADEPASNSSEAWDKIQKAAEKISTDEKVTIQKAVGMAIKDNPELYREYLKGGAN